MRARRARTATLPVCQLAPAVQLGRFRTSLASLVASSVPRASTVWSAHSAALSVPSTVPLMRWAQHRARRVATTRCRTSSHICASAKLATTCRATSAAATTLHARHVRQEQTALPPARHGPTSRPCQATGAPTIKRSRFTSARSKSIASAPRQQGAEPSQVSAATSSPSTAPVHVQTTEGVRCVVVAFRTSYNLVLTCSHAMHYAN